MSTFINPNRILMRRYEIERRLTDTYTTLSKYQLAEFFCTSPSVIERDFKTAEVLRGRRLYGEKHANAGFFDIVTLVRRRDEAIERDIRRGEDPFEVYARNGLWRKPLNLARPRREVKIPQKLKEADRKAVRRAVALVEIGFSGDEAFRYTGLSGKLKPYVTKQFEKTGISVLKEDEGISGYISKACGELIDKHSPFGRTGAKKLAGTLHHLLGVPESFVLSYAGSKSDRIAKDAEKAYELWLSGMIEEDIAKNVLHCSRPTVSKYIALCKGEEEKRRNLSRSSRDRVKKMDDEIIETANRVVESGRKVTVSEISRITGHSRARVAKAMKGESGEGG